MFFKLLAFAFVISFVFTANLAHCFDHAWEFSDGLAAVQINDKWGYINVAGNLVIANEFEAAGSFSEGFAFVKKHSSWGLINKKGSLVVPFRFGCCQNWRIHQW